MMRQPTTSGMRRGFAFACVALLGLTACQSITPEEEHFGLAVVAHQDGRFERAKIQYREVISIRPDTGEAYYDLGLIYLQQNQLYEAVKNLKQAVHFYEVERDAAKARAQADAGEGQEVAVSDVTADKRAEAHHTIAVAYIQLKDLEGANAELKFALDAKPTKPELKADIYYNLGLVRFAQDDLEGAEEAYRNALNQSSSYGAASVELAYLALKRGDIDAARSFSSRARQYGFDDTSLATSLGWWENWQDFRAAKQGISFLRPQEWVASDDPASATGSLVRLPIVVAFSANGKGASLQIAGPNKEVVFDKFMEGDDPELAIRAELRRYVGTLMSSDWNTRQQALDARTGDDEIPGGEGGEAVAPEALPFGPLGTIEIAVVNRSGAQAARVTQQYAVGPAKNSLVWYYILGSAKSWYVLTVAPDDDATAGFALREVLRTLTFTQPRR